MARETTTTLILRSLEILHSDVKAGFSRFEDRIIEQEKKTVENSQQIANLTALMEQSTINLNSVISEIKKDKLAENEVVTKRMEGLSAEIDNVKQYIDKQKGSDENRQKTVERDRWIAMLIAGGVITVAGVAYISYTGDIAIKTMVDYFGGDQNKVRSLVTDVGYHGEQIKYLLDLTK